VAVAVSLMYRISLIIWSIPGGLVAIFYRAKPIPEDSNKGAESLKSELADEVAETPGTELSNSINSEDTR
jgi:hypothetical protein